MTAASVCVDLQGLAKSYQIARRSEIQLRDQLVNLVKNPFGRRCSTHQRVWALRDVSFSVQEGQVVGILGRNGAGKSTLLKILSRVTKPTYGTVSVRGRVASLLEVGTGFHEELTGRENIFLNGSILGMRRREVERRFDAIVDFSGVEKFIDTPIKRYSSGMRLRLGFAVAAHLEPDVLVVDEVLAVGDAGFQKKCLAAMEGLRGGGRTVLFVSHNMAAVENLCSRAIWIDGGRFRMDGSAKEVIKAYLASYSSSESSDSDLRLEGRVGTGEIRFTSIELLALDRTPVGVAQSGDGLVIRMHYRAAKPMAHPSFGLRLFTDMGTLISDTSTWAHGLNLGTLPPGEGFIDLEIEALTLLPGRYALSFWVTAETGVPVYDGDVRMQFNIEQSSIYGGSRTIDSRHGIVFFPQRWAVPTLTV